MQPEVIPAILVKTREDLLLRISQVLGLVKEIQLDIMDGVFVPNKTIGIEDLKGLPSARYEFHWMVMEPEKWIEKMPGPHMHLVHVETITSFETVDSAVKKAGGSLGLAINPETPLEKLLPFVPRAKRVLVMTVHPGFSGQKYIFGMGEKIKKLRSLFPRLDIEVDGGVNLDTARHAYSSGANILAAASAIFSSEDIEGAIAELKRRATAGAPS
ncbi:MAG TPA: ribulose-phosphate 3-epimerase [Candidatus Bilamarchaeum sp.]|nr:ribulose-phosphate 3-epimerase [Candidatus Bilamarchaeum sp.]